MANIQSALIRLKTLINALKDRWQQITGIATTSFQQFVTSVASFEQEGDIDVALNAINYVDKGSIASIIETSARASAIATQPFTNNTDIMWVQEFVPTTNNWASFFSGCSKLKYIEGTYDLSNATSVKGMFTNCINLVSIQNIVAFPENKIDYSALCSQCTSLKEIPEHLTINTTTCFALFTRCRSLERVLCKIDCSGATVATEMFYNCPSLKVVKSMENTGSIGSFAGFWRSCSQLTSIPQFDTSGSLNFVNMFNGCSSLITTSEKPITLNLQNVTIWYQVVGTTQNSKIDGIFSGAPHINHVAFSGVYDKIASDVNLTVFGLTYLNEDSIVSLFKCFRPVDDTQCYIMTLNATQKAWEITLTAAEALERFEDEEMAGTYTLEDYSQFLGFII